MSNCWRHGIKAAVAATALGVLIIPSFAGAQTATTTMAVSATVEELCSVTTTSLGFGPYTGDQNDSTATLTVTCTNTTPYSVGLGAGETGTVADRLMVGPAAATLDYQLYTEDGRTTVWGETVATDTVQGTGAGGVQDITVYGRIPAGQFSTPGTYTDSVAVTVTY